MNAENKITLLEQAKLEKLGSEKLSAGIFQLLDEVINPLITKKAHTQTDEEEDWIFENYTAQRFKEKWICKFAG